MYVVKREFFVLVKIIASCLTAGLLVFFISSLAGEDLRHNNDTIYRIDALLAEISTELEGGIDDRIRQLGEVPARNPYKKFYCVEFAKEIHELSQITEKQRIIFDAFNVRIFESQLKRIMQYTEAADVKSLNDEMDIVRRELKNSANLLEKKRKRLIRQRTAYIALFIILWVVLYLYFSRGIVFKRAESRLD